MLVIAIFAFVPAILPVSQGKQPSILERYGLILGESKAKKSFLAYFVFQTGNFAAFTFLGTWLADSFSMSIDQIGGVLVFLGVGNIIGSFFGSTVVKKWGRHGTLLLGLGLMTVLYLFISHAPSPVYVKIGYFAIFLLGGIIFPVMMALLQTLSATARGTIAALGSSVLHGATTLGAYLAGMLYTFFGGFLSISLFTALCFALSLLLWLTSGVTKPAAAKGNAA
ncbi:MFS transporter [Brevibacillus borstelensis]|uniref:MFS transporter n=1 Tax=Brevibacillus borstelensis TaxID=45462 RepID=UPI0030ED10C7